MILAQAGIAKQKQVHLYAFWMIAVLPLRIYKEAIAYSRLDRKTVLNSPICKTGKTNLSTIFCKNVCVYPKITVISMKITYFLPFLPGFGAV